MKWVKRGALGLAVVVGLFVLCGFVWERRARAAAIRSFPPPGRLIDVEGGPVHLNCTGRGQPTVVLEAGASQPSVAWSQVQFEVTDFTRVCSYDRAGIGWSANADGDADPEGIARRLRAVLTEAEIAPPYVMVGQSIGGPLAMVFGDLYPDDVAGYVFVDSADPDRYEMSPLRAPAVQSMAQELAGAVRAGLAGVGLTRWQMRGARKPPHWPDEVFAVAVAFTPQGTRAGGREQAAAPAIVQRASEVGSFGSAPVVVLTAESSLRNEGAPMGAEEWAQLRLVMQEAIAARSDNSAHRIVEEVGHNIHLDDPEETARAIRDVVTSARTGEAVARDER